MTDPIDPELERAARTVLRKYDCGDSGCSFRYPYATTGMRTNGGCRCLEDGREARRHARGLHQCAVALLQELDRLRGLARAVVNADGDVDFAIDALADALPEEGGGNG